MRAVRISRQILIVSRVQLSTLFVAGKECFIQTRVLGDDYFLIASQW